MILIAHQTYLVPVSVAANSGVNSLWFIDIGPSSNVTITVGIDAHAYGGLVSRGVLVAEYQRSAAAKVAEMGQARVGVWSILPVSNPWNPRVQLVENTAIIQITADPVQPLSGVVRIEVDQTDTSSDVDGLHNLYVAAISTAATLGGMVMDASHVTVDESKVGFASSVTDLLGAVAIVRHSANSYDPEITTTTEGYACLRFVDSQQLDVTGTLGTGTTHTIYAVAHPNVSDSQSVLLDGSSLLTFCMCYEPIVGSAGPAIAGGGTNLATSSEVDALQLLKFQCDASGNAKTIWRDGAQIGTTTYTVPKTLGSAMTIGQYMNGDLCELWVLEGKPSSAQEMTILNYLHAKYPALP